MFAFVCMRLESCISLIDIYIEDSMFWMWLARLKTPRCAFLIYLNGHTESFSVVHCEFHWIIIIALQYLQSHSHTLETSANNQKRSIHIFNRFQSNARPRIANANAKISIINEHIMWFYDFRWEIAFGSLYFSIFAINDVKANFVRRPLKYSWFEASFWLWKIDSIHENRKFSPQKKKLSSCKIIRWPEA